MTDRVRLTDVRLTPAAVTSLDAAAVRLGVSTAAVVELLATRYAPKLSPPDADRLPDGFRGRKGGGRRKAGSVERAVG